MPASSEPPSADWCTIGMHFLLGATLGVALFGGGLGSLVGPAAFQSAAWLCSCAAAGGAVAALYGDAVWRLGVFRWPLMMISALNGLKGDGGRGLVSSKFPEPAMRHTAFSRSLLQAVLVAATLWPPLACFVSP